MITIQAHAGGLISVYDDTQGTTFFDVAHIVSVSNVYRDYNNKLVPNHILINTVDDSHTLKDADNLVFSDLIGRIQEAKRLAKQS